MAVYRAAFSSVDKDDGSPLTEADLRADRVIRAGLQAHFAGVFILSEESGCADGHCDTRFFLVDPLDGTKEFVRRSGEFTVNIALVDQGEVVAGVVLAPALGELFYAARGLGAWKQVQGNTLPLPVAAVQAPRLRVIGSKSHGTEKLARWLDGLVQPHDFVAAGSSLKFCRLAEGLADVYPRFGPTCQWDTAAAQGILECAGGCVVDLEGKRLQYGLERPLRNPEFMAWASQAARP